MELRPGPGGNEAEVAAHLRRAFVDLATTERQLQTELADLTKRREDLVVAQSSVGPAAEFGPAEQFAAEVTRLDERLADLQGQLATVSQSKAEIAAQLQNFPRTAISAEAEAGLSATRQLLAAGGIDLADDSAANSAELMRATVEAELAALRRELGLAPPEPVPTAPPSVAETPAGPTGEAGEPPVSEDRPGPSAAPAAGRSPSQPACPAATPGAEGSD